MLNQSLLQVAPQVKVTPLTRQGMLVKALTHAVANRATKEVIQVDGQKFSPVFKSGVGGNRSHYIIKTVKNEVMTVDAVSKRDASLLKTLGKPVPTKIQSFVKPIESGAVLEVELGISAINSSKVVPVAGWADMVEAYVAKVCGELGWPFQSQQQKEFLARVAMLRGEVENGID